MIKPRKFSEHTDPRAVFNKRSILRTDQRNQAFPIPTSPVIIAALRALYAGGPRNQWLSDSYGRPQYRYESRDGQIVLSFTAPPGFGNRLHLFKAQHGYALRFTFICSGSLRAAVQELSVETADIFLILMTRIAELRDPARDIASISLEEIADIRGVHVRHGSVQNLYKDFKEEIMRLSDMCLTMTWRDYSRGGTITFGREKPDRLLDIVDVEYKQSRNTWTSFRFRCGQALSHFLSPDGLRWIGYYSRSLLKLSPYHEAFTKKLGTYWTIVGIIAGKKGLQPRATPYTILDFCGEDINWRNPGQTVDAFTKAHDRLVEIGILDDSEILDPLNRTKGYFKNWLETPINVKLSQNLWQLKEREKMPPYSRKLSHIKCSSQKTSPITVPESAQELINDPALIRQLRNDYFFRQSELARALGVKRQTLSSYERGLRALPEDKAIRILQIWQQQIKMY